MTISIRSHIQNVFEPPLGRSLDFIKKRSIARTFIGKSVIRWSLIKTKEFENTLSKCAFLQKNLLKKILIHMSGSQFVRDYDLHTRMDPTDFREAIPLNTYETLRPYIQKVLEGQYQVLFRDPSSFRMIATTSGTTNFPKMIPVTDQCLKNLKNSWLTWGYYMGQQHPLIAQNSILSLTGSYQISPQYHKPIGSITSFLSQTMATSVKLASVLPKEINTLESAPMRQYLALRFGANYPNIRLLITANPSTLIRLAERLREDQHILISDLFDGSTYGIKDLPRSFVKNFQHLLRHRDKKRAKHLSQLITKKPLTPRELWPDLELLATWTGGHAAHYIPQLRNIYGSLPIRDHGLSATEAHMTIPMGDETDQGILNLGGAFYEFIRVSDTNFTDHNQLTDSSKFSKETLLAHELSTGDRYEIIVSTFGGLLRYRMHDLVECTGFRGETPLLRFISKTNFFTNLAGEKLSLWQAKEALQEILRRNNLQISEYLLSATFRDHPIYVCYFEADQILIERLALQNNNFLVKIAQDIDYFLQQINIEYNEKRMTQRLMPLKVELIKNGTFAKLRQKRLLSLTQHPEQYKHPFLLQDIKTDEFLRQHKFRDITTNEKAS
jgi:hypothetical protein